MRISPTAVRVLSRLHRDGRTNDERRARWRQTTAAFAGATLRELADVYRREMECAPGDRAREQYLLGDL